MTETTEQNRQKIIERIEKLLALSQSPNENEALAAAEKAQAMLAEYNLSMSDIGQIRDQTIKDNDLLTDRAGWVKPLLSQVAKLYFCGYYYQTFPAEWVKKNNLDKNNRSLLAGGHGRVFLRHSFIGEKINIIVAKNMSEYLITTMEKMCIERQKTVSIKERLSYRSSFMNACAAQLCYRLRQRLVESSQSGIKGNGTNLPALRSLYEQAQNAVDNYLETEGVKLKQNKNLTRITNYKGMLAGQEAGDSIGLDNQISEKGNDNRITHQNL